VKKFVVLVPIAAAAGILLVVVTIRVVENRLIFFPPRYPDGFASLPNHAIPVEDVWLTTEDGVRINAFYHSNSSSPKVLLWFHGNAENIGYDLPQMKVLAQIGVNILAVDYRGYGKSQGKPNEAGVYHDADAAYDYLVKQRQVRAQDIFIYGVSLGGAVAINLAARRPCGGLIVQSSFTNTRAMARRMFGIPLIEYLPKSRFDSLQEIRKVRAPILIAHGTEDEVVPLGMGRRLFAAAPEPKRFFSVAGAGHNNMIDVGQESYLACLRDFVQGSGEQ
jgi:fermentation-respiration switch protein FrsA (DUF1100 family)